LPILKGLALKLGTPIRIELSNSCIVNIMSDPAYDRLSKLPNELLVLIFQHSTDFSSVWSLIHTSSYLASVFNDHACMIGNAVLNTKVPSPTRALMQGILTLRKGTLLTRTPEDEQDEHYKFDWSEVLLLPNVSGTSSDIRWLVGLAHHVHIHTHLYIEICMQRCLQSRLGDRKFPELFEIPTWTEEQRSLLGFWRFVFLNQLRREVEKGSLKWPPRAIYSLMRERFLERGTLDYEYSSLSRRMQTTMARDYLAGIVGSQKHWIILKELILPPIPREREFGWHCQPPPTWQAISQVQDPDEIPRGKITTSNTSFDAVSDQLIEQPSNQLETQLVDLEEEPNEKLEDEIHDETEEKSCQSNQVPSQEARQDANQGRAEQSNENLDLLPFRVRYYGPSSSSSESDDDVYFLSDEDEEDRSDEDENSDDDETSNRISAIRTCFADTDSDEYEYPGRLGIRNRRLSQYVARHVRDFGPQSRGEECRDLERASLGLQFWDSMVLNPEGGPGKYMWFDAYARYGFLLWEEWRMIEFGLWSNKPIEDMSVYYQKWFRFLSPEDMSSHLKFRYSGDEDWL
jgi:hypothetical protein